MAFCRIADALYAALPLRPVRDLLIRGHMEKCPHCQARLVGPEEARGLLVRPDGLGDPAVLWKRFSCDGSRAAVLPGTERARPGFALRWASAVALAAVVAATGFWLLREVERPGFDARAVAPADRFQIGYVNVGGEPAQAFVFQPQGTDTVFVWASRNP
jgi:hypothetical protein